MKKVLFSVLAFTIILASCKKYDNEFKDLRAQIAALSTQVAGVNALVAGIQTTSITLAQLNAATASIPGLATSLAALTTTVTAIQTSLASVAANVNNISANLTTLTATVAANQVAAIAAINKVTVDLNVALNAQTVSINASTKAEITASNAALTALIGTTNTNLSALSAVVTANQTANVAAAANNQAALIAALTANSAQITAAQAALSAQATANQTANVSTTAANQAALVANQNALAAAAVTNQNALLAAIAAQSAANATNQATLVAALNANAAQLATTQTTLLAGINANAAQLTASTASLTTLINAVSAQSSANSTALAGLSTQLNTTTTNLLAAIADAKAASLLGDTNAASAQAVLQAAVNALTTQLAIANANIQTLLNSNDFFNGDLVINSTSSLTFARSLGTKVKIINGNLTIDATTLTTAEMDTLKLVTNGNQASPLTTFIGNVTKKVTVSGSKAVDLSKLTSVNGDGGIGLVLSATAATNLSALTIVNGSVTASGAAHNLSALTTVTGNYSVSGVDILDDALVTIGAANTMTLDYHGAYSYPALTTVGKVIATNKVSTSPTTGTSAISFPAITLTAATNTIFTSGGGDDVPTWVSAKSVNIKRSKTLTTLIADSSTTITLGETTYAGSLTINTNTTLSQAATVDLAVATMANGSTLTVNTRPTVTTPAQTAGVVNLQSLVGGLTGATPGALAVVLNGPTSVSMPLFTGANGGSTITSASITTATLGKHQGVANFAGLTSLTTVTIGDLRGALSDASFAGGNKLVSVTVTGGDLVNASVTLSTSALSNIANVSVSTAGLLKSLFLDGVARLSSVTTAGSMDNFTVTNTGAGAWVANATTTLNIGHTAITGATGSGTTVIITGNKRVRSLITNTVDRMKTLTVTGNDSLATVGFGSYQNNITGGSVIMQVHSNGVAGAGLSGTYTTSIFATNTAPIMVQAGLSTLKAYAAALLASTAHTGSTINFGYNVNTTGTTWVTVSSLMDADRAAFTTAGGNGTLTFVQRDGDAGPGGAVGSNINVSRELTYLQ